MSLLTPTNRPVLRTPPPLGDVGEDGDHLVLGQAGVEERSAFSLEKTGLAGPAVEEPALVRAVACADGEVAVAAFAEVGAGVVLAAEDRKVVHGSRSRDPCTMWSRACSCSKKPAFLFNRPRTPGDFTLQRQYEALRAYFIEKIPSTHVARRFGYSPGSFRVLCHQFRHDPGKRDAFFAAARSGPQHAPARDLVRERAVALRKQYLSVYDIQRELAASGHSISIHSLTILLREEGFARLPRRRDDERPDVVRPEAAAIADVRAVDLQPRTFRTRLGGLFVFVPLMRDLRLHEVVRQAKLPGTAMIPAEQAVRTLLALKLVGKERTSHVMDLVADEGIALFAGLNVVPKRSYLAAYSSSVDDRAIERLMAAWFDETPRAGLAHGASIDLDFHTVPTNSAEEPLEKHYVSRRSRSQQGMLTFLARDAEQRVLCYAHAGIAKTDQADEIIRFVDYWQRHTGVTPAELVFDSKLTTYAQLAKLHQRNIHFITLRRRTRKMLGDIYSRPASAWQRITVTVHRGKQAQLRRGGFPSLDFHSTFST